MDDATLRQVQAAEPGLSTWLTANAGSGKTKVLIDRVARLLLHGTPPERILCLTYTKAAAGEMQIRLFERLGKWAMLPDDALATELADLGEPRSLEPEHLARARRLFARAIEAPGGLKLQTIHAFCAAILRRFPLEAGVSPDFTEADERSLAQLRRELLDQIALSPQSDALSALGMVVGEWRLGDALAEIERHADAFLAPDPDLHGALGVAPGYDRATLLSEVFLGLEQSLFAQLVPLLATSGPNDQKLADRLSAAQALGPTMAALEILLGAFLTGEKANEPFSAKKLPTAALRKTLTPAQVQGLDDLALRLEAARGRWLSLLTLERSLALHAFARVWLPAIAAAKERRGWLAFDDLILRTRALLSNTAVAQWVLFKLDGGIDHILIDEAQDTSPAQWDVIELLAQEFTSGEGARAAGRTIFVVGDRKQSIYSFQGADLRGFDRVRSRFTDALAQVGQRLAQLELMHSFRSADAVLRVVDQCFDADSGGLGGATEHIAFHDKPGRVDLWPAIPKAGKDETGPWFDPLDRPGEADPERLLGRAIATEIRALIDARTAIPTRDGWRPVHEGDFLILVRRRKALFHEIIRACKAEGLEIAGADRLTLTEEPAVRDLLALLRFLALPEDDLSLAVTLRAPFFALSEDQLFRLAHGRGRAPLWQRLREAGDPLSQQVTAVLTDLMAQTDFLRPHELIERALTRHDFRRRLLARFGAEAEDGIEAFVDLALTHEAAEVPSLDGFLDWLLASDAEVKRQPEAAGHRLRVMTVHGAKGLQAPIVIVPDTAKQENRATGLLATEGDVPFLRATKALTSPEQARRDALRQEAVTHERERLLYVALTRAESWLIVAGAGDTPPESWHGRVLGAMHSLGALAQPSATGPGLRFENGTWQDQATKPAAEAPRAPAPLFAGPRHPPRQSMLSPTALGGAKTLPGDGGEGGDAGALERGTRLHRLIETLAPLDAVARPKGIGGDDPLLAEVLALLDAHPALFGPQTLLEAGIGGHWQGRAMWGQIDCLLPGAERVLAVDFKSNRAVPATADQVPEGILRQMGAYAALLAQVYPGRRIETAVLWTASASLMPLPEELTKAALARAARELASPGRALDPGAGAS